METLAPLVILVFVAAAIVVILGVFSMMRGGEPDSEDSPRWEPFRIHASSGELMFDRVALQTLGVAVLLIGGYSAGFVWNPQTPAPVWQIELGVVPAQAMRAAYGETSAEANAFGGIREGGDAYLVTAIVINPETGQRVGDAEVWGTATRVPGLREPEQRLEAAIIGGTVTYGHYFRMPENTTYYIDVRVEHARAGTQRERITYQPPT
ncbi:MAG: twin transmembrane helix small protein [Halofilum sp. (in: g-proteobacteria)]